METIPERIDWLWFLGYDLDDEIPNHYVLSKARYRWGVQAFQSFFDLIVLTCNIDVPCFNLTFSFPCCNSFSIKVY
jgi:hypothetical protein